MSQRVSQIYKEMKKNIPFEGSCISGVSINKTNSLITICTSSSMSEENFLNELISRYQHLGAQTTDFQIVRVGELLSASLDNV